MRRLVLVALFLCGSLMPLPPQGRNAEETALLAAILAHPDEDTPRLVYADWLDEQGDGERALFIRLQVEDARLPHEHPRKDQIAQAIEKLRPLEVPEEFRQLAGSSVGTWKWHRFYHRGFLSEVRIDSLKLSQRTLRDVLKKYPFVTRVTVQRNQVGGGNVDAQFEQALMATPAEERARLRGLGLEFEISFASPRGSLLAPILALTPNVTDLYLIYLSGFIPAHLDALRQSECAPKLERLTLAHLRLMTVTLNVLFEDKAVYGSLKWLNIMGNSIGDFSALNRSQLPRLESLLLGGQQTAPYDQRVAATEALIRSDLFLGLRSLDLSAEVAASAKVREALASRPHNLIWLGGTPLPEIEQNRKAALCEGIVQGLQ